MAGAHWLRACAVIAVLVILSCSASVPTEWFGDSGAIGAKVYVDGHYVRDLRRAFLKSEAFVNLGGVSPCFQWGDTVVAVGGECVSETFRMPRGAHDIMVITRSADTLVGRADFGDSPAIWVWTHCKWLDVPGRRR